MVKLGATGVLALVAVGVAGYLGYRAYKGAGSVVSAVANVVSTDLNPASSQNVVNRGFEAVTGGQGAFSDWLLRTFNPEAAAAFENRPTPFIRRDAAADASDETARLLARYPVSATREPSSIYDGAGSFGDGAGLGSTGFGGLWTGPTYFNGLPPL